MSRIIYWTLLGFAVIGIALPGCRRKFGNDVRLPPREVMIRFCWQTFDLALRQKDDFIQNTALRALGRIGNQAAVETIRSVDLGAKRSIVKTAVFTLSQIRDSAAYQALVGYTRSSDFQVRELAVLGLIRMHALYDDSVTLRILKRTFAELDSIPVDSLLYDSAEIVQEKEELRTKIAVALLKFSVSEARPYVERAFRHPEFQFRAAMVRTIGDVQPPGALSLLARFEKDPVDYVRAKVAEAWGKIGTLEANDKLRTILSDPSESVQVAAAAELMRVDEAAAVERLLALRTLPDDDVRSRAILALGDTKDRNRRKTVAAKLRELLKDPVDLIRVACVGSLGKLEDTASVSMLENMLQDDAEDVREISVGVLARLKGRDMLERLVSYLADEKYSMREVAVAGLGSIPDSSLQERLVGLVYERMRNDDEMTVRIRAAFTLLDMLHQRKYTKPNPS